MEKIRKNFGFGCMRLPMIGEDVDIEQTKQMVDCFLEQGRIIERGSHDELIAKKGKYYQLYTGNLAED